MPNRLAASCHWGSASQLQQSHRNAMLSCIVRRCLGELVSPPESFFILTGSEEETLNQST